jgi:hypothetical protein
MAADQNWNVLAYDVFTPGVVEGWEGVVSWHALCQAVRRAQQVVRAFF